MAEAADWMRAPIALAVATGMRRGELLGLRWADVNFCSRQIILRQSKNGEQRALYLNDSGLAVLSKLPRTGELCFPGIAGGSRPSPQGTVLLKNFALGFVRDGMRHLD
jgi:integrase